MIFRLIDFHRLTRGILAATLVGVTIGWCGCESNQSRNDTASPVTDAARPSNSAEEGPPQPPATVAPPAASGAAAIIEAAENGDTAKVIELLDKHQKPMKVEVFHKPIGPLDLTHDATRKMLDRMADKLLIAKTGPGEFQSMLSYQEAQL